MMDFLSCEGLPQVLQVLVRSYLRVPNVYSWYQMLVKDIENTASPRMIYLMPPPKLLEYLDSLLEDHPPSAFKTLLEIIERDVKLYLPIAGTLGFLNIVKYVRESKNNVEDKWKQQTLENAAYAGNFLVMDYLIEEKHDIIQALYHSMRGGHFHLADYFVNKGAPLRQGIYGVAAGGHLNKMITLCRETSQRFPLESAAAHGQLHIIKYITENSHPERGQVVGALSNAAFNGHLEAIKYL